MKFEHYAKKLEESEEFAKFIRQNPEAYLCAGFFVLDLETGNHIHQIDYVLPNNKIATFLLDDGVKLKISDKPIKKKLPHIEKLQIKTDLEALQGIVEDEMKNRTVTGKIKKIIAILHILDNKLIWNLQCILDGLNIVQVHIDDEDQTILKFEKHSLMELIKPMETPAGTGDGKPIGKKVSIKQLKELIEKAAKKAKEKKSLPPSKEPKLQKRSIKRTKKKQI